MMQTRVIAIPSNLAKKVRESMKSPGYGHPAHREVASGYGPCRHCLRTFQIGAEERILFTYDPFHGLSPYPLPGPIFIHAEECERYKENTGFPAELRAHAITLVAYGAERKVLEERRVADGRVEEIASAMLDDAQVRFVHARDTEAGCYDLRIERT